MISSTKRRLARGIGAGLAAVAAFGTLGVSAASASSGPAPLAGITVPGDPTAAPATLVASLEGRNEVTAGAAAGQALELIGLQGNTLSYSVTWRGLGTPTEADIHAGVRGADGPVVVPLFTTPPSADGFASGSVTVTDPTLLAALRSDPGSFYTDLHTTKFPGGAVRAQLHLLNHPVATSGAAALQESVALGSQIYACTAQPDGSFAFTQHDVDAHLTDDIHHTFVRPLAGTPQWQAPDGSAVTGKVVTKNANGAGNIAELNLDATQIGTSTGLLAHAVEVLRLNTAGGVAPARALPPERCAGLGTHLDPPAEVTGLSPGRLIPRHPGRPQEPEPAQQRDRIRPLRGLRPASGLQVPKVSRYRRHRRAGRVTQSPRLPRVARRLQRADRRNYQSRQILVLGHGQGKYRPRPSPVR